MFWRTIWRLLRGRILPKPPDPPTPDPDNEKDLLAEINRVRSRYRRARLMRSTCLDNQAQAHCEWMARTRRLSHQDFSGRLARCEYGSGSENVAAGQQTAAECVADWMSSSGHRRNLLGDWDVCGVGQARGYWCAVFAE